MNNSCNELVPDLFLSVISELALIHELSIDEIYTLANFQENQLITVRDVDLLIELIVKKSGKPWAALEFASQINLQQTGKLGPIVASSGTVGAAVELFHRYHHLFHPYIDVAVEMVGSRLALKVPSFPELNGSRWYAEIILGALPFWIERLVEREVALYEVWFRQPKPPFAEKYYQHFKCNVLFNQPVDCIWADAVSLDFKIKTAAPKYHSKIVKDAEAQLQNSLSFVHKVKSYIKAKLPKDCSVDELADYFRHSERTFQRKLAEEGTSFQKLKQLIRREEGTRLLNKTTLTIEEIAEMLGYEHGGSFGTAFRSWTGLTPAEWRARNKAAGVENRSGLQEPAAARYGSGST